jgi:hypothetical protein
MDDVQLDFAGLGAAMQDQAALRNEGSRREILQKYKTEIAMMLVGLRAAQITGRNDIPADPAESCDLCGLKLKEMTLYVDGAVGAMGAPWASMCIACFLDQGGGIGWGVGQLYSYNGANWHCIGGGNPAPCNEEDL